MADYILVVQLDIPNELEDDFNRAYDKEHVPNLLNVSGVHGCDRYKVETSTDDNIARYAAVYHIDSPRHPGQRRVAGVGGQGRRMGIKDSSELLQPHAHDLQED